MSWDFTRAAVEEVPMTPKIAQMDRFRGVPIPHIVLRKDNGTPIFTVNEIEKEVECLVNGKCAITGTPLEPDDVWFICGPKSAFDLRGVIGDAPVCGEAKDYAMQVCPYMAIRNFEAMDPAIRERLSDRVGGLNREQDGKRVPFHAAVKVKGFCPVATSSGLFYTPSRDYACVEAWNDGKIFDQTADAERIARIFDCVTYRNMDGVSILGPEARERVERSDLFLFVLAGSGRAYQLDMRDVELSPWQEHARRGDFNGLWPWKVEEFTTEFVMDAIRKEAARNGFPGGQSRQVHDA